MSIWITFVGPLPLCNFPSFFISSLAKPTTREAAEGPSVPAAQQPLVPMLRRPGSSHAVAETAWFNVV